MVENADLHLKTTKIILTYKRSPRIKQTWNYKNESLQCWNQQYIPACTLDFECSNTRSLFSGYAVINWPELFFQLGALSTYGTFPNRRFLSVAHFFFLLILRQIVLWFMHTLGTYITVEPVISLQRPERIYSKNLLPIITHCCNHPCGSCIPQSCYLK